MKNLKKVPSKQLGKFSTVFTQLGLVLVLFIVYSLLEHETVKYTYVHHNTPNNDTFTYLPDQEQNVLIQKELKSKPKPQKVPPKIFNLDEIEKGNDEIVEKLFPEISQDHDPILLDEDALNEVDEPEELGEETVPYILIEDAPIFKGCEGLSKEENKKCFEKSLTKFFVKNFDVNLAQELGLATGKHKIFSQFVIGKDGYVTDIIVKAPHKQLQKEANRIMNKLPKFTPGKQRRRPVKVKYILPVSFQVF